MVVPKPGSESPVTILQVSTSDVAGGAEGVASGLHDAYRDRGHDAWLAVGHRRGDDRVLEIEHDRFRPAAARATIRASRLLDAWAEESTTGRRLRNLTAHLGQPRRRLAIERGLEDFDFPGTRRLLDLPPRRPDVLQLHNLHGAYFDLRVLPELTARVPTVATLHDAWLFTGHCAHFVDCGRWRIGCGECPDLVRYPAVKRDATHENWTHKQALLRRSGLHVAAPSRWLLEAAKESILAGAAEKWRVIPNGVDLGRFHPDGREAARATLGLPPDAAVVLFVATGRNDAHAYKDPQTVVEAARRLTRHLPDRELVAVRLGADPSRPTEPAKADRPVPIRNVAYTTDLDEVARWHRAADLLFHAAHVDTAPLVVPEALASGTPVLATAVGGIPEQIRALDADDAPTGALVPRGDAEAMAEAAARILGDPDLLVRLSVNAVRDARARFDVKDQAAAYLAWFDDLTAGSDRVELDPARP